jgi:hypothetical protein
MLSRGTTISVQVRGRRQQGIDSPEQLRNVLPGKSSLSRVLARAFRLERFLQLQLAIILLYVRFFPMFFSADKFGPQNP